MSNPPAQLSVSPVSVRCLIGWSQPTRQPGVHFVVEMAAVLAVCNPVVRVRPDEQPARHLHALQRAPVFERVVQRYPEVVLADRQQDRCLEVCRAADRVLVAPHCVLLPRRAAGHQLAMVDAVARAPLGFAVHEAGVADDGPVAGGGGFEPVGDVAAVAGAGRRLSRSVDEREPANRFVGRLVHVFGRALERIELDRACEALAEAGRSRVVGQEDDVAGTRQQMIVPAQRDLIAPHAGGAPVDLDQERIFPARVECRRPHDHAVDGSAARVREPEVLGRLPIELGGPCRRELREPHVVRGNRIDPDHLGGVDRARPVRHEDRALGTRRDRQVRVDAARWRDGNCCRAARGGHRVHLFEAGIFRRQIDALAVRRERPAFDAAVEARRQDGRRAGCRPGPRGHRDAVDGVDLLVVRVGREIQRAAIGPESGMFVRDVVVRQLPRLAAPGRYLVELCVDAGVRRRVAVRRRREDDGLAVRRPDRVDFLARIEAAAAVARALDEFRAGQQIHGLTARVEALHEQADLPIVQPPVPVADGETVVRPDFVFLILLSGRVRVDQAREQQSLAVRTPGRRGGAGRNRRCARGLAAGCEVERVDLIGVVALASGGEGDPAAVSAPRYAAFGRFR